MKRIATFMIMWTTLVQAQLDQYNQIQVDTFKFQPLDNENLKLFKNILETNNNLLGWTRYYSYLGYHKLRTKEHDSAIFYSKKAIEYFDKMQIKHPNEEMSLTYAYYSLGYIKRLEELYSKSTTYLLRALDLADKFKLEIKPYIMSSLAANHLSLGNNELSLFYYQRCIKDSNYLISDQAAISAYNRLGLLYSKNYLKHRDSSLYYYHKAIKRSLGSKYKNNLPAVYGNAAEWFRASNIDSALWYYRKSVAAYKDFVYDQNASHNKTNNYQSLYQSYIDIHENKTEIATVHLQNMIDTMKYSVKNRNERDLILMAYENLIMAFEKKGQLYNANRTLKDQVEFEVEFNKLQMRQELEKLQLDFETKKREEEINQLKKASEQTNKILEQQRTITWSSIALGCLFLGLGGLIMRQRTTGQKMKEITLEQRLLRSQMNPHFLSNALNSGVLLMDTDKEKAKLYILRLAKLLRLTLENSRTDLVALGDEIQALQSFLELQSNFSQNFDFKIKIDPHLDQEEILIPPMLIQPLVENAIIHGVSSALERGSIVVKIVKIDAKSLLCTVKDNGQGFNGIQTIPGEHTSLSLSILKDRLAIYNKKNGKPALFEINNQKNQSGAEIVFAVPYKHL